MTQCRNKFDFTQFEQRSGLPFFIFFPMWSLRFEAWWFFGSTARIPLVYFNALSYSCEQNWLITRSCKSTVNFENAIFFVYFMECGWFLGSLCHLWNQLSPLIACVLLLSNINNLVWHFHLLFCGINLKYKWNQNGSLYFEQITWKRCNVHEWQVNWVPRKTSTVIMSTWLQWIDLFTQESLGVM